LEQVGKVGGSSLSDVVGLEIKLDNVIVGVCLEKLHEKAAAIVSEKAILKREDLASLH
jgi:hypothetical protein